LKNVGNYNRLANKFYCVSLTQLLHTYAIPGNSSKLERATCRNLGRHCGQHKFCYLYSRRGYVDHSFGFTLDPRQFDVWNYITTN